MNKKNYRVFPIIYEHRARCKVHKRKIEPRFAAFNELKEAEGKRDWAKQEIFSKENQISLSDLPWKSSINDGLKSHCSSLKENRKGVKDTFGSSMKNFFKKIVQKRNFFLCNQ